MGSVWLTSSLGDGERMVNAVAWLMLTFERWRAEATAQETPRRGGDGWGIWWSNLKTQMPRPYSNINALCASYYLFNVSFNHK